MRLIHEDLSLGLEDIRTEQVPQVIRDGMTVALHCLKDERLNQMFCRVLVDMIVSLEYVNRDRYKQVILETRLLQSVVTKVIGIQVLLRFSFTKVPCVLGSVHDSQAGVD